MTNKEKLEIVQGIGKILWALCVLVIMVVMWLYIIDGLVREDYMQTIAYASVFALVKLNKIKEKL